MRWMKKLLLGIYLYMGIFFGVCLFWYMLTGNEPAALITGISAAVGVESLAAGLIRIYENRQHYKHEKEIQNGGEPYYGDKQNQLEGETDQP